MGVADSVDIVVLNCDNNGLIQDCISGIKKNTFGYNLIIVDQNSHDGSREWLVENDVASHLVLNKRNVGVAEGRNQGIRVGKYSWIVLVDSDIIIDDPNWLDKIWNYTIDRRIGFVEIRIKENDKSRFGAMSFCMLRRQSFYEVGFFDKQFVIGEDKEWFARFENSWWNVGYCYDTDVVRHLGQATMNGRLKNKVEELRVEAKRMLEMKYTPTFLDDNLGVYEKRRVAKEKELIYGE